MDSATIQECPLLAWVRYKKITLHRTIFGCNGHNICRSDNFSITKIGFKPNLISCGWPQNVNCHWGYCINIRYNKCWMRINQPSCIFLQIQNTIQIDICLSRCWNTCPRQVNRSRTNVACLKWQSKIKWIWKRSKIEKGAI